MEKADRDAVLGALGEAVLASTLLRGLLHRLLAKHVLDEDDARVIYDYALSHLEDAQAKMPAGLFDEAWRLARKRAETEQNATGAQLQKHRPGTEDPRSG